MSIPNAKRILAAREIEVLCLVGEGLTNAEIGRRLRIAADTVKSRLVRAMGHLGVRTRGAAVLEAQRRGLLGAALIPLIQPDAANGAVFGPIVFDRARAETPIRTTTGEWLSTKQAAELAAALISAVHHAQGGQL